MEKTVKEILSENRDSIISSIKYVFKVWKHEDVKVKMIEFLAYAEKSPDSENLFGSKKVKNLLKIMVQKMSSAQRAESNLKIYGKENPKLADIMAFSAEIHERNNEVWHPIYKTWVKNEGINPSMQKTPKFA